MSTENTEVNNQEQVNEPTEIEQRALEMGWRPQSEFDGDPIDFVDAKEFISRKPLYDKISQQSKQIKNVNKALDALKDLHSKVSEAEYNKAVKALREERKQAMANGDADGVEKAEDQLREAERDFLTTKGALQEARVSEEPVLNPVFLNWQNRNPWYTSVKYMQAFADDYGMRLQAQGVEPEQILREVEKAVKKEFPSKFSNPNKENAPDVGSSRASGKTKGPEYQLNEMEYKAMQAIVRTGAMTKDEYIASLKKVKGI